MKKSSFILVGFAAAAVVVAAGTVSIGAKILTAHSQALVTACSAAGPTQTVRIQNNVMTPQIVTARRCDKLTITNRDPVTRYIAFGEHDRHVPYDGVSGKILRPNESLTVTLVSVGAYHFHDHFHDEVAGMFVVY